jgi:autotransporter translocation and assembly factor TamB
VFPDQPDTPLLDPDLPGDLVLVGPPPPGPPPPGTAPPGTAPPEPPAGRLASRPWLVARVELPQVVVEARDVAEGSGFRGMLRSEQLVVTLGDAVGVEGEVTIDNADADILGRHYQVDPSWLRFDGTTDPQLDLHLSHAFPDLTLFVDVAPPERASNPKPRFSSDNPAYTPDQLFGFFLGGEPGGDPGSQTREAFTGVAARTLSGRLGRRIGKELPIQLDAVSCEPTTSAATGSCTFGKWISQQLYLAYRQRLGTAAPDENTGDVQVQYRLGRKTVIEGTGGDRRHYGLDLLWRHRW